MHPEESSPILAHARTPYLLYLEVEERQDTLDDLIQPPDDVTPGSSGSHMRRTRKQRLKAAVKSGGGVAKGAVGIALNKGMIAGQIAGRAAVGAVGNVREIREHRHQRKEMALAQGNDPFSITETPVEHTAQMQAADENGESGGSHLHPPSSIGGHEEWQVRKQRIQQGSELTAAEGWNVAAVVIKAHEDLRQEAFCMHMINVLQKIFRKEKLEKLAVGLRTYSIQSTSSQAGVIEAMTDAASIDSIKRQLLKTHNTASLEMYYRLRFSGAASSNGSVASHQEAQRNCMYSVAAYAIVQYVLQLKDRHNGNILIDSLGRMVHVGFAFMLGWSPGGITFEKPQFKLTKDIVDVWGGRGSPLWDEFVTLMVDGVQAVNLNWLLVMRNVEMLVATRPRFSFLLNLNRKTILRNLRRRFLLYKNKKKIRKAVIRMVDYAYDNFWTTTYAKFQLLTNGIVA